MLVFLSEISSKYMKLNVRANQKNYNHNSLDYL